MLMRDVFDDGGVESGEKSGVRIVLPSFSVTTGKLARLSMLRGCLCWRLRSAGFAFVRRFAPVAYMVVLRKSLGLIDWPDLMSRLRLVADMPS